MKHECAHCEDGHAKTPNLQKYFVGLVIIAALALSYFSSDFAGSIYAITTNALNYFVIAVPWILAGVFLGGIAIEYIPRKWFIRELGGTGPVTVVKASIAGIFIDVCSHGALAFGLALYRSGASVAAVSTFLLATPWLGFMETFLLIGFLGIELTVILTVTSFAAAITIGIIMGQLEQRGYLNTHTKKQKKPAPFSLRKELFQKISHPDFSVSRLVSALKQGYGLFAMIGGWLVVGFLMAGLALTFITPETIQGLMGYASVSALPLTALIASLIEVCSEGSVPLAAVFKNLGASVGAVFVFLMAGVASDITEIGAIADNIGRRTAVAFFVVALLVSLFYGYLLNFLFFGL